MNTDVVRSVLANTHAAWTWKMRGRAPESAARNGVAQVPPPVLRPRAAPFVRAVVFISLCHILGSGIARGQDIPLFVYTPPILIYEWYNHPNLQGPQSYPKFDWNSACAAAAPFPGGDRCSGKGTLNDPRICTLGGRGAVHSLLGEGCWYRVTYTSNGNTYYDADTFYQNWAYPRYICPNQAGSQDPVSGYCVRPIIYQENKTCPIGNPVYPSDGSKIQDEEDFFLLDFGAEYRFRRQIYTDSITGYSSVFGTGWGLQKWGRSLILNKYSTSGVIIAKRDAGRAFAMKADSTGVLKKTPNDGLELTQVSDVWTLTDKGAGTIERYDAGGRLTGYFERTGKSFGLQYSTLADVPAAAPGEGYLIGITTAAGRSIALKYNSLGSIASVASGGSTLATYSYDTGRPDLVIRVQFADGYARRYLYEEALNPLLTLPDMGVLLSSYIPAWPPNLPPYESTLSTWAQAETGRASRSGVTGIIDELNQRQATYTYDTAGRVVNELLGGVPGYAFNYAGPLSNTIITDALGNASTRTYSTVRGALRLGTQSQPAGSGCAASTSAQRYDVNGNVESKDDFNGTRACFAHDLSRNLEISRVEGLATSRSCSTVTLADASLPAQSRKVTSQWHPDWSLLTKLAEPGRLTTQVYNGQPDPFNANAIASCAPAGALLPDGKPIVVLCKEVQQSTSDANGGQGFGATLQAGVPTRTSSWTYNQFGQVLTAKGPRTDVNDTTTYTYYASTSFSGTDPNAVGYTLGDMQTVTNALGKVTQYTQYNKHGQLLQSTNPNGVVANNTYDLRQRLLSTGVGGQTTSYTYDPVGQLTRVTLPDSSWIGYEYDAARRKVATLDNLGNRVEYTLDNAGNRTAENVRDSVGALRRSLARSIDALGRVEQTTGRQ